MSIPSRARSGSMASRQLRAPDGNKGKGFGLSPDFFKMEGQRKMLFVKEINPYTVSDKAVFRNVDKTLTIYVRSDATTLVVNLKNAQEKLKSLNDESDMCERFNVARAFARAIFGDEQGDALVDFYNDPLAIISACGMYFDKQLKAKITKAQKK